MMLNFNFVLDTEESTKYLGRLIAREIEENFVNFENIFSLYGEVGSGKTFLCREIIKTLIKNSKLIVSSPSFNIIHSYDCASYRIYHIDLYRVKSKEELENIGLIELLSQEDLLFIEWPEIMFKGYPVLENKTNKITLKLLDNNKRICDINYCRRINI